MKWTRDVDRHFTQKATKCSIDIGKYSLLIMIKMQIKLISHVLELLAKIVKKVQF